MGIGVLTVEEEIGRLFRVSANVRKAIKALEKRLDALEQPKLTASTSLPGKVWIAPTIFKPFPVQYLNCSRRGHKYTKYSYVSESNCRNWVFVCQYCGEFEIDLGGTNRNPLGLTYKDIVQEEEEIHV